MKRCVVTGGAGFIGSHLTDRLLRDGHQVTVLDNFATGRPENLAQHREESRLKVVNVDVANAAAIQSHFEGVELVFHLAGLADIVPSIQRPLDYHRANVDGTAAVLEASRLAGVGRFVYAASSSCYGLPHRVPTGEHADIQPRYPYAVSKRLGEELVLYWGQIYHLPVVSLRLFNVYGPRARTSGAYGAVFGVFLSQRLHNNPITIVGDGTQTRDFTHVSDVVGALVAVAESNVEQEIFNVGSGQCHSINRLAELLGGEVVHIPKRPGEPDCTLADIEKIRRVIGWESQVSFEDGVAEMLACIESFRDAPVWTPVSIAEATRDWFQLLSPGRRQR